jgi:hypothetical protein
MVICKTQLIQYEEENADKENKKAPKSTSDPMKISA